MLVWCAGLLCMCCAGSVDEGALVVLIIWGRWGACVVVWCMVLTGLLVEGVDYECVGLMR